MNVADRTLVHAEVRRDCPLLLPFAQAPSDFVNVRFTQLAAAHFIASGSRPMDQLVSHVFCTGRPTEMKRVDAAQMPLAAGVCGVGLGEWGRAVDLFADNAAGRDRLAVDPNHRPSLGPRPEQAPRTAVTDRPFEELNCFARGAVERATVNAPTTIVIFAPTSAERLGVAILNRAYSGRLLVRWGAVNPPPRVVRRANAARVRRLSTSFDRAYTGNRHPDPPTIGVARRRVLPTRRRHSILLFPLISSTTSPVGNGLAAGIKACRG